MPRSLTQREQDLVLWISRNRGVMSSVAERARVSPQFVQMVLKGKRRSKAGVVERLLREAGAPVR